MLGSLSLPALRSAASVLPFALAAVVLGSASCSFDLDKLYTAGADAGADAGLPDDLIGLFRDSFALSDACIECAEGQCADVNASCRADEQCSAFTACVAERDTPAQREACRARFASWLGERDNLLSRDVNGPLGTCVLSQRCADVCRSHEDVSCLDTYSWPMGTSSVSYRLRLTDTEYNPVAAVIVRVCNANDPNTCSSKEAYTTDDNGIVDVPLPVSAAGGFVGYLEIEDDRLAQQLVRFGWPISEGAVMNLPVIGNDLLQGLSVFADKQLSDLQRLNMDDRGMVQVRLTGCSGIPLNGAVVSIASPPPDAAQATWYASNGTDILPDFTASETSDLGAAGIINIPPGRTRLQVSLATSERLLSDMTVPVRAGYITTVLAVPVTAKTSNN